MTISPVIPVFQCPRDIALKLFREAGRAWNASTLEEMGDHLFNFCVTNSSLRDWILQSKGEKGDAAFHNAWRAKADGLFGECADIANASKHLVVKPVSVGVGNQKLSALGPNGVIKGLEKERKAFSIVRSGGEDIDLLMFFFKICRAWEELFENDPTLETLPFHGEFLLTTV
ncbi:hypothetical protein ACQJ22_09675 [Pseudomonas fragariae (ex Marin et al. 2024)]|uniref:hypothetical protein n=1 Tax=Pseudomonas TaxID=286 RepID=UPI0005157CB8|nr:hypothetical protein [Pseudomonas syringae]MCH5554107.1 hypothetical protein [Pseudomonas syringae pv. syringae]MCH5574080.1 hypothetical protein [Pseudomonas syringae pv. syringae]MCH5667221.1 hypothetical protein [Pseudomonas syringae pv. syringae]